MLIRFVIAVLISTLCISAHATTPPMPHQRSVQEKEPDIPPTEDLMREHGILNRLLLIYEEIIRRIDRTSSFPANALERSVEIMQSFIENYHEKLEEEHIFPLFLKNNQEMQLIQTLKEQHNAGRQITNRLKDMLRNKQCTGPRHTRTVKRLLHAYIRMYRPHEAREDTVLFPKVRSLLSEKEFDALGERFEQLEQELFGKNGFETVVDRVAAIEKELGIYALAQFTPKTD